MPVRVNSRLVFWGFALVSTGIVALAVQSGIIDRSLLSDVWQLWPLILIAIGISIIVLRSPLGPLGAALGGAVVGVFAGAMISGGTINFAGCGDTPMVDSTVRDGTFGTSAEVSLDFTCGELHVSLEPGDAWRLDLARGADAGEPRIEEGEHRLSVETANDGPFGSAENRREWGVVLPTHSKLDLSVDVEAADSTLDLTDGTFSRLSIDTNAGSVHIAGGGAQIDGLEIDGNAGSVEFELDVDSTMAGEIEFNAGSVAVCAPDELTLAITLADPNETFSHNLDEQGLRQSGDVWTSEGAVASDAAVRLHINGNAGSLTVNPEEGCE